MNNDYESEWIQRESWPRLEQELINKPNLYKYAMQVHKNMAWINDARDILGDTKPWFIHPAGMMGLVQTNKAGVTPEQLKLIFPQASDEDIHAVVTELEGNLEAYKLNTPLRLRHFFAQIKGEVGPTMKGRTESFQFSPSALLSFSNYYRAHPAEAEEDGYARDSRTNRITRRANEQAIGRKHYSRLNGNRSDHPDDGLNLRGRGLIQITGYEKYHGLFSDYNNYWPDTPPDFVNQPEKVNEMPYAIRSAVWFWLYRTVYRFVLSNGAGDVIGVTNRVNGRDMGLTERQEAYELCTQVFK